MAPRGTAGPLRSRSAKIGVGNLGDVHAGQPAKAVDKVPFIVERGDQRAGRTA